MKFDVIDYAPTVDAVAPYAGAWIEIFTGSFTSPVPLVAPYAGAWIEIFLALSADYL